MRAGMLILGLGYKAKVLCFGTESQVDFSLALSLAFKFQGQGLVKT